MWILENVEIWCVKCHWLKKFCYIFCLEIQTNWHLHAVHLWNLFYVVFIAALFNTNEFGYIDKTALLVQVYLNVKAMFKKAKHAIYGHWVYTFGALFGGGAI